MRRIALLLLLGLGTGSLQAQSYSIDWFRVAGGGGTSTGGVYALSGTIGQADAGFLSGGNYTLEGGFWGIVASVQLPGSPLLTITRTATNTVVVAWPSPSSGFVLQQNPAVGPTNWANVAQTPDDNGTLKSIVINPPTGNLFFRLKQ